MISSLQSSIWVVDEPPILALYWLSAFLTDQSSNAMYALSVFQGRVAGEDNGSIGGSTSLCVPLTSFSDL